MKNWSMFSIYLNLHVRIDSDNINIFCQNLNIFDKFAGQRSFYDTQMASRNIWLYIHTVMKGELKPPLRANWWCDLLACLKIYQDCFHLLVPNTKPSNLSTTITSWTSSDSFLRNLVIWRRATLCWLSWYI